MSHFSLLPTFAVIIQLPKIRMTNTALFQFLRELRENNNREWFQRNKERYETLYRQSSLRLQVLIGRISEFDPDVSGLDAKQCVFRIYRDIRFSPDKTPYKTYFGAYIAPRGGRKSEYAGYYLHLEPDNAFLSGGIWRPPSPLLKKLRQDIYDSVEEFLEITEETEFKRVFPTLEGEMLKRVPTGFPSDCACEHILRHKDFIVSSVKPDVFFCTEDWIDRTVEDFKKLLPFNRFLNYTVDELFEKAASRL